MTGNTHFTPKLFLTAATCLLLATGCSDIVKQPYPAKEYFGIEPGTPPVSEERIVSPATAPSGSDLMAIRAVRVTAPYDGLAFVYRDGPAQYTSDYYVNWIASPSALLTAGLTSWLDRAGPLAVIATGSTARADWIVDCDVTQLVVDRTGTGAPRASVTAHVFLIKERGTDAKVIEDAMYEEQSTAAANTPSAYAEALGVAYHQVLIKLTADLRAKIQTVTNQHGNRTDK